MSVTVYLTIQSSEVPATLTDFPVYVDLSDMPTDFWNTVTNGGGDIRVFQSDGTTECAREVVSCDTATDTGELHFLANSVSSSVDTVFKIVVDGTSSDYAVTDTYGRNAVWADYEFVSHDGGGTDSTGNYTPTANGGVTAGGATGKIGDATDFDGVDDYFSLGTMGSFGSSRLGSSTWTTWFKTTDTSYASGTGNDGTNTEISVFNKISFPPEEVLFLRDDDSDFIRVSATSGTNAIRTDGNWHKETIVIDNGSSKYYLDGADRLDNVLFSGLGSTLDNFSNFQYQMLIAAREISFFGVVSHSDIVFDEIRIRNDNTTTTANWENAEHKNQHLPSTFYTATATSLLPQFLGFAGL